MKVYYQRDGKRYGHEKLTTKEAKKLVHTFFNKEAKKIACKLRKTA